MLPLIRSIKYMYKETYEQIFFLINLIYIVYINSILHLLWKQVNSTRRILNENFSQVNKEYEENSLMYTWYTYILISLVQISSIINSIIGWLDVDYYTYATYFTKSVERRWKDRRNCNLDWFLRKKNCRIFFFFVRQTLYCVHTYIARLRSRASYCRRSSLRNKRRS